MTRTVGALLVAAAAALTGCSTAAVPSTASPVPSTSSRTAAAVAPVEVGVRLVDGSVDPFPDRVDVALGRPVVLQVETDTPAEIHVHGYDHSADAAPGAPARIEFVADVPGVFEVEAHPDTLLLQLAVQ
ncbi:hypothetical protein BH11ACT6_BH11ACT6_03220 [soil metagenome]